MNVTDDPRTRCARCGATTREEDKWCTSCGAPLTPAPTPEPGPPPGPLPGSGTPGAGVNGPPGRPPGPPPGRPDSPRRRTLVRAGAALLAGAVSIGLGIWFSSRDGNEKTATGSTTTTARRTTTSEPDTTSSRASTTTRARIELPTTSTIPEGARRYVGLTHSPESYPSGVNWVGGALILDDKYGIEWVNGPNGDMFWLERPVATAPDGSVAQWNVLDAVDVPPGHENEGDTVILGDTQCEVDGRPAVGVVGMFAYTDAEWYTDARWTWQVDASAQKLDRLTGQVRCVNTSRGI